MKKKSTWNAPPRPRKRGSQAAEITRDRLAKAIQSFTGKGGSIRQLPPEPGNRRHRVGVGLDTGIESLFDT